MLSNVYVDEKLYINKIYFLFWLNIILSFTNTYYTWFITSNEIQLLEKWNKLLYSTTRMTQDHYLDPILPSWIFIALLHHRENHPLYYLEWMSFRPPKSTKWYTHQLKQNKQATIQCCWLPVDWRATHVSAASTSRVHFRIWLVTPTEKCLDP